MEETPLSLLHNCTFFFFFFCWCCYGNSNAEVLSQEVFELSVLTDVVNCSDSGDYLQLKCNFFFTYCVVWHDSSKKEWSQKRLSQNTMYFSWGQLIGLFYKMTVGFSGGFACCWGLFVCLVFLYSKSIRVPWAKSWFSFNAEFCWAANSSTGTVCALGGVNFKLWVQPYLDISELHSSKYMEGKHADEFKQVIITWIRRVRNWSDKALDSSSLAHSSNAVQVLKG